MTLIVGRGAQFSVESAFNLPCARVAWGSARDSGRGLHTNSGFRLLRLSASWGSCQLSRDLGWLSLLLPVPPSTWTVGLPLEFSHLARPPQMWRTPSGQSHRNAKLASCGLVRLSFDTAPGHFCLCLPSRALLFLLYCPYFVDLYVLSVGRLVCAQFTPPHRSRIFIYIYVFLIFEYVYLKHKFHEYLPTTFLQMTYSNNFCSAPQSFI